MSAEEYYKEVIAAYRDACLAYKDVAAMWKEMYLSTSNPPVHIEEISLPRFGAPTGTMECGDD